MRTLLLALGLALAAPAGLATLLIPCVKDGQSAVVSELLPDLGPGSGSGLPVTAAWTPAAAQAWDADFWSSDDFLDFSVPSGGVVSVSVYSNGGSLWKNGKKIDSGAEGNCIEVYFCKSYTYTMGSSGCIGFSSGGVSGQTCQETAVSVKGTYYTPQQQVCPC